MKFPKKLEKGDCVALVAPSSAIARERVPLCIKKIEDMGYRVKIADNLDLDYHGLSAGPGKLRAEWLNKMFADPEVDAIFCVRGGDASARIMEYLDFDIIKNNPKLFVGYSDITNLHLFINQHCGYGTIHGPMVSSNMLDNFDEETERSFFQILNGEGEIDYWSPKGKELKRITPGKAEGELVGGNLTLVSDALGTPYDFDPTGKIIFLEDVHSSTTGTERDMYHLRNAGYFNKAAGILIGQFNDMNSNCDEDWIWSDCILDILSDLDVPAIWGVESGHEFPMMTLPMGAYCEMDADNLTIKFTMER